MQLAEHIQQYNIPQSAIHAAKYLREMELDAEEARERVALLTNKSTKLDDKYVIHVYKYLIDRGLTHEGQIDLELAEKRAVSFVDSSPWIFAKPDVPYSSVGPAKLDAVGNPKRRKGAKKELAIKCYKENKELADENKWARKDWIKCLMEEVGLSEGGASTYYANLKNGTYK